MKNAKVILTLKMRTNNPRFNTMYITAFEIQRPWKIEGVRFSDCSMEHIVDFNSNPYDPIPCLWCDGRGCPDCMGMGSMSGLGEEI